MSCRYILFTQRWELEIIWICLAYVNKIEKVLCIFFFISLEDLENEWSAFDSVSFIALVETFLIVWMELGNLITCRSQMKLFEKGYVIDFSFNMGKEKEMVSVFFVFVFWSILLCSLVRSRSNNRHSAITRVVYSQLFVYYVAVCTGIHYEETKAMYSCRI